MKKRTLALLIAIFLTFASAVGYIHWQLPKMELLAKYYISQLSKNAWLPVKIETESIGVRIFPPQVILHNTTILPKEEIKDQLQRAQIKTIVVEPSIIDLILGKFWLNQIQIEDAIIEASITNAQKTPETPKFQISTWLKKIPVSEFFLKGISLRLDIDQHWQLQTQRLYVRAYNQKNSLLAKIKETDLSVTNLKSAESLNLHVDTQFMLTDTSLSISKLKLIKEKAYLIGSGNLRFDPINFEILEGRLSSRMTGNIQESIAWAKPFIKKGAIANVDGDFKFDISFDKKNTQPLSTKIEGHLQNFKLGRIQLGDIGINGSSKNMKTAKFSQIKMTLPGKKNKAALKDINVNFQDKKNIQFSANLEVSHLQLHSFLKESNIAEVPVWLDIKGNLKCQGTFAKGLLVECPGELDLKRFKVNSRSKNIAHFESLQARGKTTITDKHISYAANLRMANSKGSSSGIIDFDKGFDIKYQADTLDFQELGEIAEFSFSGITTLKGSTKGNSRYAIFDIDIDSKDFEFANYYFGNLKTQLNYQGGTLFFKKTEGHLDSTRYKGAFEVDLLAEQISGDFVLPFFKMSDIQQAVFKKVNLEDRFLGSGSGKLKINSSLNTSRLSFSLGARLFKGSAFGENFDEAQIDLVSREGVINVDRGVLSREKTKLNMFGNLNMDLDANLKFQISNGDLKNSTLLKKQNLPISGLFSAQGTIKEKLGTPKLYIQAQIDDFVFHKKRYGKGSLTYQNEPTSHNIGFNLENQLQSKLKIPTEDNKAYYFEFDAENFDIAPMLGYSVSEVSTKDYVMSYSGSASGYYKFDDFWNSEFSALAKQIVILYKGNRLASTLPTNLELKNNKIFLNDFKMAGNNQNLSIENSFSTTNHSKFLINGQINISFFKLFAPFIKRIDGTSTVHLEIHIKKNDFSLIGSSYTSNAYVEFPDFPHPFENLTADVIYNQNKIIVNSITGRLAGGSVLGNGEFLLYGPTKFKMNLNLDLDNINLNFPNGYQTSGDAQIQLSGTEPPFALNGKYLVSKGLIEEEFGGADANKNSGLLDELLRKNEQSPIVLDIDIDAKQGIAIKNSLVEGDAYGSLRVYDKIEAPKISGGIKLGRNSRLKFQDTEFEITDSQFIFRGLTPINPTLFLTAKTRVQDYDINMSIQGDGAQPKIRMSSQPSLTDRQIISLLAFGSITDSLQDEIQNPGQQNQSSLQIGTSLLKRNPLGQEIQRIAEGWDVQFSSVIDEGSNLAVPKFTVSKKFSKKVEASFNQRTGERSQTELRVRYDLGDNLSTVFRLKQQEALGSTTDNNVTLPQTDNQFGIDLEYKKEFE